MDIKKLLQLLTEDRSIEYINSTLEGKVPAPVISALSSKMKKGRYDKEAMAIFDIIQEWANVDENSPVRRVRMYNKIKGNLDYLYEHAGMVYSILKKLKKGKSDWDPEGVVMDFLTSKEDGKEYWKAKYSEANADKPELSKKEKKYNTTGLATARVKELSDCYAIFPKNYKNENDFLAPMDMAKSYDDIRKISAEIANRDTSGLPKAKENHWCVAVNNENGAEMFKSYKRNTGEKGIFIIFVKKKEDSSPDWNERWLTFFKPTEGKKSWNQRLSMWEMADKFDTHVALNSLPKGARKFILKVAELKNKKPDTGKEIERRMANAKDNDDREVEFNENATELDKLYKEAVEFFKKEEARGKIYQIGALRKYLKGELQGLIKYHPSFEQYFDAFSLGHYSHFFSRVMGGHKGYFTKNNEDKYVFHFGDFEVVANSAAELGKILDKCLEDNKFAASVLENSFKRKRKMSVLNGAKNTKFGKPNKELYNAVGGNKQILDMYLKKDGGRRNTESHITLIEIPSAKSQAAGAYTSVYVWYDEDHGIWHDEDINSEKTNSIRIQMERSDHKRKNFGISREDQLEEMKRAYYEFVGETK